MNSTKQTKGTLKTSNLSSDTRIQEFLNKAGEEYKAGDDKHNWMNMIKIIQEKKRGNPDSILNEWGYDVGAVNNELTGEAESQSAYNVYHGERERKRLEGQAQKVGEKIDKAAEKVSDTMKGFFK